MVVWSVTNFWLNFKSESRSVVDFHVVYDPVYSSNNDNYVDLLNHVVYIKIITTEK